MEFSIMQWNVLHSFGCTPRYYPYCDAESLDLRLRIKKVLNHIKETNPDILLLNEYESNLYTHDISKLGYDYHFTTRNTEKDVSEGEITFFKRDKLYLLNSCTVNYDDLADADDLTDEDRVNRRKGYVGNIVRLGFVEDSEKTILIANTHLYWHPESSAIRTLQLEYLLKSIHEIRQKREPLVLGGDFNSTPDSTVYALATEKCGLQSAYFQLSGENPSFTSVTKKRKSCLDYLFYTPTSIMPVTCSPLPIDEVNRLPGLPSLLHPSDHLPLFVRFALRL